MSTELRPRDVPVPVVGGYLGESRLLPAPQRLLQLQQIRNAEKVQKITIDAILTPNSTSSIVYYRAEPLDVDDLYNQCVARLHDFTYSHKRKADYGNSTRLLHSADGIPKRSKFLSYNMPMWIDLSATRSYTKKPDPPNSVVQPQIRINFSVVTTESYILRVNAYYPSQYALTSIGSGQTSSRVVTFLPTISTIAR